MGLAGFFAKAFRVKTGLTINDEIGIGKVDTDPTTAGGIEAPIGSILVQQITGKRPGIWVKYGAGNTSWQRTPQVYKSPSSNPGINNDGVDTAVLGILFFCGDTWINLETNSYFVCVDNDTGDAVWRAAGIYTNINDDIFSFIYMND